VLICQLGRFVNYGGSGSGSGSVPDTNHMANLFDLNKFVSCLNVKKRASRDAQFIFVVSPKI
jgi:hypothetical protein